VAEAYGLPPSERDGQLTVAELFARELRGVEVGDRIHIGPVDLIVRDVTEGRVTAVGLGLEPSPHQPPPMPLFFRWDEVTSFLRRLVTIVAKGK
jgi:cell volume regulation protein A